MISSKKITQIGVFLIAAAFIFTVCAMLIPQTIYTQNTVGTLNYSDNHSVTFVDSDYYTTYSEGQIAKISLNGNTASSESKNVSVSGSEVTILGGGTYVISGELSDGNIVINSADGAEVRLVLCGAKITSSDFSALYVKQAEKVVISLAKGTENYLTDGSEYNTEKLDNGKPTATLYSKDDITINGEGTLTVTGNYQDGIKANDSLKVTSGTIKVSAKDEGINANDYIALLDVAIEVTGGGDAIKCENESADYGFIALDGTTIKIPSSDDAIYASSSIYADGISAEITATDDAIHAEKNVKLNPEKIQILKCREGIEGAYITIDGGEISIISSDDGINAVGENSTGGFGRPMGMHKENITDEDIYLTINGGNIYIETSGDGVDSNGAAVINGGNIQVYGPENSGNSSLDFEYGFLINGGNLIAAGSSGMAELPSISSTQKSIVFYLGESYDKGITIEVLDSLGNKIISGSSSKKFDWVCVSTPNLVVGEKYSLVINGTEIISQEVTDVVNSVGNNGRRR